MFRIFQSSFVARPSFGAAVLCLACAGSEGSEGDEGSSGGGSIGENTGGSIAPGSGGNSTGGTVGSGGTTSTGGVTGSGGDTAGGGEATGGMLSSGGSPGTGSAPADGGAPATGGLSAVGGSPGTGGEAGECPFELVGWATTGSGTTGGGQATPQTVTSAAELEDLAAGSDPRVILVSGRLDTGSSSIEIGSNKTIRGIDKNATIYGGISIRGNNVIVQNLTVEGKGQGNAPSDSINSTGASNIWFDHLNVLDGGDGIMDLTNGSDRATVSWCKFWYTDSGHDHRLALLFGNGSEKCAEDGGKQNHTIHHNWFSDLVDQRMPRLLFGQGHIFNNFYNSPGNGYCVGAGSWASILVENNYFKDVNDPHKFQDGHPSYIAAEGNVYDNTSGDQSTGSRPNAAGPENSCEENLPEPGPWDPPYLYTLDAAGDIPDLVMKCAGPQ